MLCLFESRVQFWKCGRDELIVFRLIVLDILTIFYYTHQLLDFRFFCPMRLVAMIMTWAAKRPKAISNVKIVPFTAGFNLWDLNCNKIWNSSFCYPISDQSQKNSCDSPLIQILVNLAARNLFRAPSETTRRSPATVLLVFFWHVCWFLWLIPCRTIKNISGGLCSST